MHNYKCNKTGKLLSIQKVTTKVKNGKTIYQDYKGKKLDVTKLGEVTKVGVRTDTKNRV